MGFLKKLLVEEVNNEIEEDNGFDYSEVENVDVNTEGAEVESLISDIYGLNNLSDLSKSIFKVEELLNSLPKEMPKETKRSTVLSILGSFGLSVEEVVSDGETRCEIISSSMDKIKTENNNVIENNNASIEEKKTEIQELEKDNASREEVIKTANEKTEDEIKKINELIKFTKGE